MPIAPNLFPQYRADKFLKTPCFQFILGHSELEKAFCARKWHEFQTILNWVAQLSGYNNCTYAIKLLPNNASTDTHNTLRSRQIIPQTFFNYKNLQLFAALEWKNIKNILLMDRKKCKL